MHNKATINTVAECAGVSRGTVDRVLNNRPHVKKDVYDKVVKAMKDLGYVPPKDDQAKLLGLDTEPREVCKLGVLFPHWPGYYRNEILRGQRDARKELRADAVELVTDEYECELPDEIAERLETLMEQNVKGIALCAKDHPLIAEKINELEERGIPVVTFNSDIPDSRRLCYVGQNVIQSGRVAGELMGKFLMPGDKLLIAIGNHEFIGHRQRMEGFCGKLSERGIDPAAYDIVETYNDYNLSYRLVREEIMKEPNLKGIYMANHSVSGCAEAIRDTKKIGQIRVICHDLTDATKRLLKNEEIDFAIAQDIHWQGYRPLTLLRDYIRKGILPDSSADPSSIDIICSENIDRFASV